MFLIIKRRPCIPLNICCTFGCLNVKILVRNEVVYNERKNYGRVNHTIMHEIGHIVLGHTEDSDLAEAEVSFFAKYALAPPILINKLKLETPEIIKQGGRYGVKLKAKAPSIHMIKVDVESTFEPIIGSEMQSKELIKSLTDSKNSNDIWKSEIFGRSLDVIVQEGIQAKLAMMPDSVRFKLCQTLTKIINKGSSTMIAIVL